MHAVSDRVNVHEHVSSELASLSDVQLSDLISEATPMHTGIGGNSALLMVGDTRVFVKTIPLTDLEQQPNNFMSTANLFDLPLYYQYGIGSAGFSAWRELVAHQMTTDWVLTGMCANFPLMYHWRILPSAMSESMNSKELEDLDSAVQYWGNSQAVRTRLEAIHDSSAHIALFLEYVPQTLYEWLGAQLRTGGPTAERALAFVEENLKITHDFFNAQGFSHFDAHFNNILADDKLLFSDFGLALSSKFDLTKEEMEFLTAHRTYDRCAGIASLVHCIITSLFEKDQWAKQLQQLLKPEQLNELPATIATTLEKYAPIALVMHQFNRALEHNKSTRYPASELEHLLLQFTSKTKLVDLE